MSADFYEDCPCCNGIKTVRIDNTNDVVLESNGTILHLVNGFCIECNTSFK